MSYQDQWTRYHHKKTDGISPSSGNGFLYTAYAVKVGLPVDKIKLSECMSLVRIPGNPPHLIRNPNEKNSPFSRDEILGLSALGLLQPEDLTNWNFSPFAIPKFSFTKLISQLWEISPEVIEDSESSFGYSLKFKHRNYFWLNNLDQLYRFSFSVPVTDRLFILKNFGKFQFYNPAHLFYAAVAKIDSLTGTDSGIRFIKYGKSEKAMAEEFPKDHPIYKAVHE